MSLSCRQLRLVTPELASLRHLLLLRSPVVNQISSATLTHRNHSFVTVCNCFSLCMELMDDQVRKIEERRNHTDGSFNLRLGLRFDEPDHEGKPVWNTG